ATRSETRLRQQLTVGSAAVLALIVYVAYARLAVSTAQLLLLLFLFSRLVPRLAGVYQKLERLATVMPAYGAVVGLEQPCRDAAPPFAGDPHLALTSTV